MMNTLSKLSLLGFCVYAQSIFAATPEAAAEKLGTFLDALPDAGPAYAVTVVSPDKVLLSYARGLRRATQPKAAPVTADTPFYIASQTKAFVGLLAAKLDAKGILKLDSTLADHWPDLKLPDGVDPKAWTLRDLLSHQLPITADEIAGTEAYVMRLNPADYPALLARHAKKRDPGFKYSNLGYNIYGAILHKATGKTWEEWLAAEMLQPMGLKKNATRTSAVASDDITWGHLWLGAEQGWHEVAPKPDPLMHAAGGMISSPAELGRWLQMHLQQQAPRGSGFDKNMFVTAHTPVAQVDPKARNAIELPCDGYALGWNVCNFEGHKLYVHGGGYTGTATMMAFSPDLNVGIAVFSNSDNMTGWLVSRTIVQYLQYLIDHPEAEKWAQTRITQYPQRINQFLDMRRKKQADARSKAEWGDWSWQPSATELNAYLGRYQSADGLQTLIIRLEQNKPVAILHALRANLEPAAVDLFAAQTTPLDAPEAMKFTRDAKGVVVGVEWQEDKFLRVGE